MWGRIVELAAEGRYAHRKHGFLVVETGYSNREEVGRVPLADIEAVIVSGHGVTVSRGLLAHLSERNCPVVIADDHYLPTGILMPVTGHHLQAKRFDAQVAASLPQRKRVWAALVRAKIMQQACVAAAVGSPDTRLLRLARDVKSGDSTNCEAQAARAYWPLIFGPGFRRDRASLGTNAMLNYGYTVLRAATARAVAAAGLHPTLGVHHKNQGNPMRLVDDLMEPFRPFVDLEVLALHRDGFDEVNPAGKARLVEVLSCDLAVDAGTTPVGVALQRAATSLADFYLGDASSIWLPTPQIPSSFVTEPIEC